MHTVYVFYTDHHMVISYADAGSAVVAFNKLVKQSEPPHAVIIYCDGTLLNIFHDYEK